MPAPPTLPETRSVWCLGGGNRNGANESLELLPCSNLVADQCLTLTAWHVPKVASHVRFRVNRLTVAENSLGPVGLFLLLDDCSVKLDDIGFG